MFWSNFPFSFRRDFRVLEKLACFRDTEHVMSRDVFEQRKTTGSQLFFFPLARILDFSSVVLSVNGKARAFQLIGAGQSPPKAVEFEFGIWWVFVTQMAVAYPGRQKTGNFDIKVLNI